MSADIDKERADFEAWARRTHRRPGTNFDQSHTGVYKDNRIAAKWAAWHARAAIPQATAVTLTIGLPPIPPCARIDKGTCGCAAYCGNYFARQQAPAEQAYWLTNCGIGTNPVVDRSAIQKECAKSEAEHLIGQAHIICDQAGIPQGEIIGRLVALSGKGDAVAALLSACRKAVVALAHAADNPLYKDAYDELSDAIFATPQTAPKWDAGARSSTFDDEDRAAFEKHLEHISPRTNKARLPSGQYEAERVEAHWRGWKEECYEPRLASRSRSTAPSQAKSEGDAK